MPGFERAASALGTSHPVTSGFRSALANVDMTAGSYALAAARFDKAQTGENGPWHGFVCRLVAGRDLMQQALPGEELFARLANAAWGFSQRYWRLVVVAMLALLHVAVFRGVSDPWARALLLAHLGLLLLWQPFLRAEQRVSPTQGFILSLVAVAVMLYLDWWLLAFWVVVLAGLERFLHAEDGLPVVVRAGRLGERRPRHERTRRAGPRGPRCGRFRHRSRPHLPLPRNPFRRRCRLRPARHRAGLPSGGSAADDL